MFSRIFTITSLLIALGHFAFADSEFDAWLKGKGEGQAKLAEEFQQFQEQRDREFGSFLKKKWKEFSVAKGQKRDVKPKPKRLPQIKESTPPRQTPAPAKLIKPSDPGPKKQNISRTVKKPSPPDISIKPSTQKPVAKPSNQRQLALEYYGKNIILPVGKDLSGARFSNSRVNNSSIAQHWDTISSLEYSTLLNRLIALKKDIGLNGWGYGNLVTEVAEQVYPSPQLHKERVMLIWFLMSKSGYRARAGYADNRLILMLSADYMIYGTTYITYEGEKFFILDFKGRKPSYKKLRSYPGNYPGANAPLDIALQQMPKFPASSDKRQLSFSFRGKKYNFSVPQNKRLVDFLNTYPDSSFEVYFDAPMQRTAAQAFRSFIQQHVQGMSEAEQVNFVLRLVQRSFPYGIDQEQFGAENYLFPDETLYYPKSDCEDRVALFSYILKNILGKKVVGLHYPNHVAAAVVFKQNVGGDTLGFQGAVYTVADPTYIGADAGMTMPQFKNVSPKIIEL